MPNCSLCYIIIKDIYLKLKREGKNERGFSFFLFFSFLMEICVFLNLQAILLESEKKKEKKEKKGKTSC